MFKFLGKCVGGHEDEYALKPQLRSAWGAGDDERSNGPHHPDFVITAHNHFYARTRSIDGLGYPATAPGSGVRYFVTGGGGAPLYRQGPLHARYAAGGSFHHFLYMRVQPDVAFFWAIDDRGRVRDSGCVRARARPSIAASRRAPTRARPSPAASRSSRTWPAPTRSPEPHASAPVTGCPSIMGRLVLISVGGAAGHGRALPALGWLLRVLGPAFPYGTLAVNVIGSFLLGAAHAGGPAPTVISPTTRLVLGTGLLGGFTTYSAFNQETLQYLQQGAWATAALYVAATLVICLVAGALGMASARALVG